jgi:acyl-coenzyme A synthetase/AMP-(fatty) acid ligase/uncharacterized membrane protein
MRRLLQILFYALCVGYPALMFYVLVIRNGSVRALSLIMLAAACVYFMAATAHSKNSKKKNSWRQLASALPLAVLSVICFLSNAVIVLKLYPVFMNLIMLTAFGLTLFSPPVMIFRFATLADRSIRGSLAEKRVERYCRKVTLVWCGFFVANGSAALVTVLRASDLVWSIYNGGVSYILMGILFAGEFIIRKMTDKKMPKAVALSQFTAASRAPDTVLCYEQNRSSGVCKTWRDFLDETARLRAALAHDTRERCILHVDDCWLFLVSFTALLQCRKTVLLTANIASAYLAEIRSADTALLTDQRLEDSRYVPDLLAEHSACYHADADIPPINADETVILMYTSGTTGRPKVVEQRLTEFEEDNRFVLAQYGEEFLARSLCSTVNQHHIYGLLFSILLPFTAAVPFRRARIAFPQEFERLDDASYMIITVPAFLKRSVELIESRLPLKNPYIITSGGALSLDVAQKTVDVLGFWPIEVYGSTETSGIAYRQSKNGPEWTPFANAALTLHHDGCLVVRSPYIKDPAGFVTGDLVEMLPDGRFLLKGRADSIVKIEEKRISLPEMENRLLQSGLVSDVCVVALEDRRQYLAAALSLNEAGRAHFQQDEKLVVNRYFSEYLLQFFENTVLPKKWRYLDALPVDAQGKKQKQTIEALFVSTEKN